MTALLRRCIRTYICAGKVFDATFSNDTAAAVHTPLCSVRLHNRGLGRGLRGDAHRNDVGEVKRVFTVIFRPISESGFHRTNSVSLL